MLCFIVGTYVKKRCLQLLCKAKLMAYLVQDDPGFVGMKSDSREGFWI